MASAPGSACCPLGVHTSPSSGHSVGNTLGSASMPWAVAGQKHLQCCPVWLWFAGWVPGPVGALLMEGPGGDCGALCGWQSTIRILKSGSVASVVLARPGAHRLVTRSRGSCNLPGILWGGRVLPREQAGQMRCLPARLVRGSDLTQGCPDAPPPAACLWVPPPGHAELWKRYTPQLQ